VHAETAVYVEMLGQLQHVLSLKSYFLRVYLCLCAFVFQVIGCLCRTTDNSYLVIMKLVYGTTYLERQNSVVPVNA